MALANACTSDSPSDGNNMTANEVYKQLIRFIDNDFTHLNKKVDKLIWLGISTLATIVAGLVFLVVNR